MVEIGLESMLKLMDRQFAGVTDPTGALRPFIDGALFADASFICAPTTPTLSVLLKRNDSCKEPLSIQDALNLFKRVKRTILDDESAYSSPLQLAEISDLVFLDGIGEVDHACRSNLSSLKTLRNEVHRSLKCRVPSPNVRTAGFTAFIEKVNGKVFAGDDRRPSKADIELVAYALTHFYETKAPVALVTLDKCQSMLAQDCARLLFNPESPLHLSSLISGRNPNDFVVFTGRYDSSARTDSDWIHFTSAQVDGRPLRIQEMYTWRFEKECADLRAALEAYRERRTISFVEYSASRTPAEAVNFKNWLSGLQGLRAIFDNHAKIMRVSSAELTEDGLNAAVMKHLQEFNAREQRKAELNLVKSYVQDEAEEKMPSDRQLQLLERKVVYFKGQVETYRTRVERLETENREIEEAKKQLERDLEDFLEGRNSGEGVITAEASHDSCRSQVKELEDELARRPFYVPAGISTEAKDAFAYARLSNDELKSEVAPGRTLADFKDIDDSAGQVYETAKKILELPQGAPFVDRAGAQRFVEDYELSLKNKERYDQVSKELQNSRSVLESSTFELLVNMMDDVVLCPVDLDSPVGALEHECLKAVSNVLGDQVEPANILGVSYASFRVPAAVASLKNALEFAFKDADIHMKVKVRVLELREY